MPYKPTGRPPGRPRKPRPGETQTETPGKPLQKTPTASVLTRGQIDRATEGLSPRHAQVAAAMITGATRAQALRGAGFNPESRSLRPTGKTGKAIDSAVIRALRRAGVTLDLLAKRHRESLDAKDTKFFPQIAYMDPNEGMVVPREQVIAHGHRLEAVELGYRAYGALKEQEQPPQTGVVHEIIEREITLPDGSRAMQRIVRFDSEE
jgi:predicted DNA-binding protein (UPF0251 family)